MTTLGAGAFPTLRPTITLSPSELNKDQRTLTTALLKLTASSTKQQVIVYETRVQGIEVEPERDRNKIERIPMNKFLRSLLTVERTIQLVALVGVIVFLGYLGVTSFQRERTPSVPSLSPTRLQ